MTVINIIGLLILASPFVALFIHSYKCAGLKETVQSFSIVAGLSILMFLGVILLTA